MPRFLFLTLPGSWLILIGSASLGYSMLIFYTLGLIQFLTGFLSFLRVSSFHYLTGFSEGHQVLWAHFPISSGALTLFLLGLNGYWFKRWCFERVNPHSIGPQEGQ